MRSTPALRAECPQNVCPRKVHGADMIRKKLEILETEINQVLSLLGVRCGFVPGLFEFENL